MNILDFKEFENNFKEMGKNMPGFGIPFESGHLSGSQLYNFFFNQDRVKDQLDTIRRHLDSCDSCRKHIELFESLYPDRKSPKIKDLFTDYQYALSNAYYKLSQYDSEKLNWKQKFILKVDKAISHLLKHVDIIQEKAREVNLTIKEAIKVLSQCKEVEVLDSFDCTKDLTIYGTDKNLIAWGCKKDFSITLSTYYDNNKKIYPLNIVVQLQPAQGIMCPSVKISLVECENYLTYKAETNSIGWAEFSFDNMSEIDSDFNIRIPNKS